MNSYGEDSKASEEDSSKRFFALISSFARSFRSAIDHNIRKREEAAKALRIAQKDETRRHVMKSRADVSEAREDLFNKFHQAQEASADTVLSNFKLNLHNR
jgi:hypothetical protein